MRMRALGTQQEERWVQDGFMGECVWGEARKWAGYLQAVRERAIPNGRKAVKESRASCYLTLEPIPPLRGPHIWPSLTICFYCKSPLSLKGPWCASGWMAPNHYHLFLVCLWCGSLLFSENWLNFWASFVAQTVKNLSAMQEDLGSLPGLERSPGEENGNPLHYSCLENSMDRGAS